MSQPDADPPPPSTFLVERYWPGIDELRLRRALPRLDSAARQMRAEGLMVEHVGSILMPTDQVVFTLIRATTEAVVREVNERAEMPIDRIATAIQLPAEHTRHRRADHRGNRSP